VRSPLLRGRRCRALVAAVRPSLPRASRCRAPVAAARHGATVPWLAAWALASTGNLAGMVRTLATALALNRVAFGVNFLGSPARAGRLWIGAAAARRPESRVFGRALGARDLALGLGALRALQEGDDDAARAWMAGHALSDGADLLATLAARRELPAGPAAFAVAVAGASTAIGAAAAMRLGRDGE
jgi:hypothetical protein